MSLPYFNGAQLEEALSWPALVNAMEEIFRANPDVPPRHHYHVENGSLLMMPAWQNGRYYGTKLVTIRHDNRERGLPTIHGLYALFSGITGEPLAVLDGRVLTLLRTAATSALAAGYLSRSESRCHLLIGAGALSPYLARAIASVRPNMRIVVWNRTPAAADTLVTRLAAAGFEASVADDLSRAVSDADVISTATQAVEPLVLGEDLRPGTHLDLVGAYTPTMAEADPEALSDARIIVDTWEGAKSEAGDLIQAVEANRLRWEDVGGDLSSLVTGRVAGRQNDQETTVFKSVGASIEDLAAAGLAWELLGGQSTS